jgi:hypothetical protein
VNLHQLELIAVCRESFFVDVVFALDGGDRHGRGKWGERKRER